MAKAVDIVANELLAVATPGEGLLPHLLFENLIFTWEPIADSLKYSCILCAVDQVQLDRAKKSTKSAILMNLESRVS